MGCDWFSTVSPVSFDLPRNICTVTINRTQQLSFPIEQLITETQEIELEQLNRMIDKGATGYLLYPCQELATPNATDKHNPLLQRILDKYEDVFAEPKELPPHRDLDHAIPLIEGAAPPQMRPYRVPQQQQQQQSL